MDKKKYECDLELLQDEEYEEFIKECQGYLSDMDGKKIPHLCLPSTAKSEKLREYADIVNNSNLIPPYRKASYLEVSLRSDATEGECLRLFQSIDDSQRGPFFVGTCVIRFVRGKEDVEDRTIYRVLEYMRENQNHSRVVLLLENEDQLRKVHLYADPINIRYISAAEKNRISDKWEKTPRRIGFI